MQMLARPQHYWNRNQNWGKTRMDDGDEWIREYLPNRLILADKSYRVTGRQFSGLKNRWTGYYKCNQFGCKKRVKLRLTSYSGDTTVFQTASVHSCIRAEEIDVAPNIENAEIVGSPIPEIIEVADSPIIQPIVFEILDSPMDVIPDLIEIVDLTMDNTSSPIAYPKSDVSDERHLIFELREVVPVVTTGKCCFHCIKNSANLCQK